MGLALPQTHQYIEHSGCLAYTPSILGPQKLPKKINLCGRQFVQTFYQRKGVTPNSYSFSMVSENKILKCFNNLSANKATGLDGIPSRFVRDNASVITCPLTLVINFG